MKKLFIIVMPLAIFYGCSKEPPDFRSVRWGMTEEEVRANEPDAYIVKEYGAVNNEFSLNTKPVIDDGLIARLQYTFEEGKLTAASYEITLTDNPGRSVKTLGEYYENKFRNEYGEPAQWTKGMRALVWTSGKNKIAFGPSIDLRNNYIYGIWILYMKAEK